MKNWISNCQNANDEDGNNSSQISTLDLSKALAKIEFQTVKTLKRDETNLFLFINMYTSSIR